VYTVEQQHLPSGPVIHPTAEGTNTSKAIGVLVTLIEGYINLSKFSGYISVSFGCAWQGKLLAGKVTQSPGSAREPQCLKAFPIPAMAHSALRY